MPAYSQEDRMVSHEGSVAQIAMGSFLVNLNLPPQQSCHPAQHKLLSMVAHDLKAPLSIILAVGENLRALLQQGHAEIDRAELAGDIDMILNMGTGMEQLIDRLLSLARIESGNEALDVRTVDDLAGVFAAMAEAFRVEARRRDIALHCHIAPDLPAVSWDLLRIQYHVFNNIFANALKYTPGGGTVELRVGIQAEQVVVEIADDGPGIPPQERERIFHPFERLGVKVERAYQGSGLGLYNAYLLTQQHGGTIRVDDGLHGRGVRFVVTLPVKLPSRSSPALALA